MPNVVFVVGTTASGKSDLALQLSKEFQGVIVNADSIQMFQELDIGSAKPSQAEMQMVPHYLFSFVKAPQTVTVGDFYRKFFSVIKELPKNQVVFVVGGTGFYFQALEKGLPKIPGARLQFQTPLLEKWKVNPETALEDHKILKAKDPTSAARIHFNDHYRLARALDIIDATGKSVTQVWLEHSEVQDQFPYPLLKLGLKGTREELDSRIRRRTEQMLERGLVQEVKQLIASGFENWDPLLSVGYKQVRDFLLSHPGQEPDRQTLVDQITQQTLRLAKKQRTWFQRDPQIHWLQDQSLTEARKLLQDFLKKTTGG